MGGGKAKVIIIGGPTATGKTEVAISLAEALDGEIINADSMQVYRHMDIGTAKPGPEQRALIPHHMLDVVDPDESFNASLYRSMALPLIEKIASKGKVPIVVGGTGLYIKILRGGLFSCPAADPELRRKLALEYDQLGALALYKKLEEIDPEAAARIHPNDKIRVTRALEIYQLTGKRPSDLARGHGFKDRPFNDLMFCLYLDREELYSRINRRCVRMIEEGLIDETRKLLEKGYSPELKPMQAIGYRHVTRYILGHWPLEEAIRQMQKDTRRYAKRQITWFKGEKEFIWLKPDQFEILLKRSEGFLC